MEVPDLTQRIIGYRQWYIDADRLIRPVGKKIAPPWKPGPQHAECWATTRQIRTPCIPVVNSDCECGFYAMHDLYNAESYGSKSTAGVVQGIVSAWGRIAVHPAGFRAEWVEIMAIILPEVNERGQRDTAKAVAKKYGVPTVELDRVSSFAQEFGTKVPKNLIPHYDPRFTNPHGIPYPISSGLNITRSKALLEVDKLRSGSLDTEDEELPQWYVDVLDELDPECPEAMAGLYDLYVPNMGDLLVAVNDPPTPNYERFPPDPEYKPRLDFETIISPNFSEHLCTNGVVAFLPTQV